MLLQIVPVYAALLALLFLGLSVRVIRTRRQQKVALGDGDNPVVRRAMRVQANFAEYAPFCLLLITFVELGGAPGLAVHGLCLALLAGRLVHAYGVSGTQENFRYRVTGMTLTFAALAGAAVMNLGIALSRLT